LVIVIGLGSNLPGRDGAPPAETLKLALARLSDCGVEVIAVSPFYKSEPVPKSDQPWFVNAVAQIETELGPEDLLTRLHEVEEVFGRARRIRNEARILDLDLLDYQGQVTPNPRAGPVLPHPRMQQRRFVLKPLADLAPEWRHPVLGKSAKELLDEVPEEYQIVLL